MKKKVVSLNKRNIISAAVMIIIFVIFFGYGNYAQSSSSISPLIAFVSDTQEPMMIEKLWLKGDNNETATKAVFAALRKEQNLKALFHLGDITALGFWPGEWEGISNEFAFVRKAGVSIYPELGNHEYFIFSSLGRNQFFKHFSYIKSSWYAEQIGETAVILLNSNFSDLSDEEISSQQKWYERKLRELDENPSVHFVIVGTHHSPYTNSTVVDPSSEVQKYFVPAFMKSRKAKLFVSGHAHTFEHFRKDNKDFIVCGGGGGLLHPVLKGREARYRDLFTSQNKTFHYVTIGTQGDSMVVRVKMLNSDFRRLSEVYRIGIGR
ncbi:MAG TPA: metallophosphoesterase [Ignavibacteriales bacterium]|nr:metallophosphoesterase [Ignavibacteriales bacterium]